MLGLVGLLQEQLDRLRAPDAGGWRRSSAPGAHAIRRCVGGRALGCPLLAPEGSLIATSGRPGCRGGGRGGGGRGELLIEAGLALASELGLDGLLRRIVELAVRVVESFAKQVSVALESARARRELSRLVVLEERERIARELHDGII
ncbi:MAG TPA: hypothetical protein VKY90_21045, partial [Candidatus Dormibacteraeota bacterium]|nr:hypothetical protein [Candidatus Dormibacteraeota bacterium]